MRLIVGIPELIEDNCIGCGFCEEACIRGAIKVIDGKAKIDDIKCTSCFSCASICPNMAIMPAPLPEPKVIKFDYEDVDPIAIQELCDRAQLDPERPVCVCTLTPAKEVAAAIIKGARTTQEVAAMTGAMSNCSVWCREPVLRLLEASGVEMNYMENKIYPIEPHLSNISEEIVKKYPEYHLDEDKKLLKKGDLPFLPEML